MSESIKVPDSMVERGLREAVEKLIEADGQASLCRDLLEDAFGLIANVDGFTDEDGGSWPQQPDEWRMKAREFTSNYNSLLADIYQSRSAPPAPEPEPVPEWRRLVDEAADRIARQPTRITPLGRILYGLTRVELKDTGSPDPSLSLAGIVAVCEAQVDYGWQADPDIVDLDHQPVTLTTWWLVEAFVASADSYQALGNRAAAWLRYLTEADA